MRSCVRSCLYVTVPRSFYATAFLCNGLRSLRNCLFLQLFRAVFTELFSCSCFGQFTQLLVFTTVSLSLSNCLFLQLFRAVYATVFMQLFRAIYATACLCNLVQSCCLHLLAQPSAQRYWLYYACSLNLLLVACVSCLYLSKCYPLNHHSAWCPLPLFYGPHIFLTGTPSFDLIVLPARDVSPLVIEEFSNELRHYPNPQKNFVLAGSRVSAVATYSRSLFTDRVKCQRRYPKGALLMSPLTTPFGPSYIPGLWSPE